MIPTRTTALAAPGAAAAALWLGAWGRGEAATDDLLDRLAGLAPDTPTVLGAADGAEPSDELLRRLRAHGVTDAWPLLPRPGRSIGWPRAIEGEPQPAILCVTIGENPKSRALLRATPAGWTLDPRDEPAPPLLLAEALPVRPANRRFAELLDDAATDLARLGLDRAPMQERPSRWSEALTDLPHALDHALAAFLQRIAVVLDAIELALADDGAAVTAAEAGARGARLRRLHDQLEDLVTAVAVGTAVARGPAPTV